MASGWQVPDPEPGPAPGLAFGAFGPRLVAYIVDIVIATCLIIAVALLGALAIGTSAATGSASTTVGSALLLAVSIVLVTFGYFPWFWSRGGATPGMKMLGLVVVRDIDGGPISGGQAILRLIGYWVSGAVFYLGYIWIFVDKRRRGWHDLIAGTVVVQRR